MGEFILGIVGSLVATVIYEVIKFLLQNYKGGGLMFPGMANPLVA